MIGSALEVARIVKENGHAEAVEVPPGKGVCPIIAEKSKSVAEHIVNVSYAVVCQVWFSGGDLVIHLLPQLRLC